MGVDLKFHSFVLVFDALTDDTALDQRRIARTALQTVDIPGDVVIYASKRKLIVIPPKREDSATKIFNVATELLTGGGRHEWDSSVLLQHYDLQIVPWSQFAVWVDSNQIEEITI